MQKLFNFKSKLIEKNQLSEFAFELKYEVPADFEYKAGQFVVLLVTKPFRRSYSVAEFENALPAGRQGVMTFLIDIRPMGPASKYFLETEVGAETIIMGPYGLYSLQETNLRKVFIATSTGIAPFLPMLKEMKTSGKEIYKDIKIDFYYGIRFFKHDIGTKYLQNFVNENFKYTKCVSQPEPEITNQVFELGRVTDVVPKQNYDWQNTEFYVCGSPQMVEQMREILKEKGAEKVFFEKF